MSSVRTLQHERYLVAWIRKGSAQIFAEECVFHAGVDDLIVVRHHTAHRLQVLSELEVVCVTFNSDFVLNHIRWSRPLVTGDERNDREWIAGVNPAVTLTHLIGATRLDFEQRIRHLAAIAEANTGIAQQLASASQLIWTVHALLTSPADATSLTGEKLLRNELRAAVRLLTERPGEPWTSAAIAREVALSESALRRAFLRTLGVTPRAFLNEVRLRRLKHLLATTHHTIEEISHMVGWRSTAQARKAVQTRWGVSPRKLRESYRVAGAATSAGDQCSTRADNIPN